MAAVALAGGAAEDALEAAYVAIHTEDGGTGSEVPELMAKLGKRHRDRRRDLYGP